VAFLSTQPAATKFQFEHNITPQSIKRSVFTEGRDFPTSFLSLEETRRYISTKEKAAPKARQSRPAV